MKKHWHKPQNYSKNPGNIFDSPMCFKHNYHVFIKRNKMKIGNTDDKQIPCARIDFRGAMPTQRLCSLHWLKKVNNDQSRAIINNNIKSLNEIETWIQNFHKDTNWRACHQERSVRKVPKQRVKVDLLTIYDNDTNSLLVHD